MELRILRYFLVVAREENMTRAAKFLHITQPTLSRQIMQMEEEFGVKLFRRSNHNIILTPEGMLLRRRAQELVELADKTAAELMMPEENISGEIAIGCGETKNVEFLADVMKSFRREYPDVYFSIYTGIADDVKERIEKGLLDFGLLIEPVDISKYSFVAMPYKDYWCAMVRRDDPLAAKESVCAADLADRPLVLASRSSVKNQLDNWFGPYAEQIHIAAYMNLSAYNKNILVSRGLGVALGLFFRTSYPHLAMVPMEPRIENGSFLVWKKNEFIAPPMARFIAFTKSYIASHQTGDTAVMQDEEFFAK